MMPRIKVIGVGGSGSNTISRMVRFDVAGVELIAVNTDAQALHFCKSPKKILIGKKITGGLGAGMDVSIGRTAAKEDKSAISECLKGADMVFVASGLGGGTGSGASPVVCEISKNLGILTAAVVTLPFSFEGAEREKIAREAAEELKDKVDALLIVSNDKLLKIIDEKTTVSNAFEICDEILKQAVSGITDLMLGQGIITIDFAQVASVMKGAGRVLFGIGKSRGENRAVDAALKAINSSLLDFSIKGSRRVLFNVAGNDISLKEIKEAAKVITENVDPKALVVFGAVKDSALKRGEIKITVIAAKS